MALGLGSIWSSTGSLDYYVNYIENLRSMQLPEFEEILRKYLYQQPAIVAALLPESSEELQLKTP
jgi:hypothetical protein